MYRISLLIILTFALAAAAQQPETIALTDYPVPAWPADGVVSLEMKDKYVFIDLAKNEYVVRYPENLGSETFEKDGPGPIKMSRYELLRAVEPRITVEITSSNQKYKYVYTVANDPSAKQSIDQLALSLPPEAGNEAIKGPEGWFAIIQRGRTFKLKNPDWIKTGTAAVWSFSKPEQVVQAGSVKPGFELESELRPGFTVAYVRKAESVEVKVATHGNVPKAVKDQIDALLAVEYNSKTVVAIAPKFAAAATDQAIASDFVEGINFLTRAGELDANSDSIKAILAELKTVQGGGSGSAMKLPASSRSRVEGQIVNALKIAFRIS